MTIISYGEDKNSIVTVAKALAEQQPINLKIALTHGYTMNVNIQNYNQPLLFTFDNRHIAQYMENTSFDNRMGWGYDYVIKKGWNICSF